MTGGAFAENSATSSRLRILVVEDDMFVGMCMEDILIDMGCDVFKAPRIDRALHMVQTQPLDGAFLDVNVADVPIYPVAHALRARAVPFAFVTGYGASCIDQAFKDCTVLSKPLVEAELLKAAAFFARRLRDKITVGR